MWLKRIPINWQIYPLYGQEILLTLKCFSNWKPQDFRRRFILWFMGLVHAVEKELGTMGLRSVFEKRSCSLKPADWYTHVATRDQVRVACWWLLLSRNKTCNLKEHHLKCVLKYIFYMCNICFHYTLMQLWHNCLPKQKLIIIHNMSLW